MRVVLGIWLLVLSVGCGYLAFTNIDMTPQRLFITYWPYYVAVTIWILVAMFVSKERL